MTTMFVALRKKVRMVARDNPDLPMTQVVRSAVAQTRRKYPDLPFGQAGFVLARRAYYGGISE